MNRRTAATGSTVIALILLVAPATAANASVIPVTSSAASVTEGDENISGLVSRADPFVSLQDNTFVLDTTRASAVLTPAELI